VLPGCNLTQLTNQQVHQLKESLWEHGVIVVRQQRLTASQLEEFAKQTFGNLMFAGKSKIIDPEINPDLQSSCVVILGNPKGHTQEVVGKIAWQWHHDKDGIPRAEGLDMNALYVVMLYGVEVPKEGVDGQPHTTQFFDMVEAYNNLDCQHQQQLEQMSMYHMPPMFSKTINADVAESRAGAVDGFLGIKHPACRDFTAGVPPTDGELFKTDVPKKVHPIVSTHKVTGKKGLYLGSNTAVPVGMEDTPESAKHFWQELFQTVLERTPVYSHVWNPGDIVFWDNSQVMHRGTPYDAKKYQRVALRIGAVDTGQLSPN
jgi:taurine dioxygenase